jgi:hypothetical protein
MLSDADYQAILACEKDYLEPPLEDDTEDEIDE